MIASSSDLPHPQPLPKANGSHRGSWSRGANWVVGLIALLLLALSVGSYWWHRRQLYAIQGEHIRLMVNGPARLQAAGPTHYTVTTTRITGAPVPAEVKFALFPTGAGKPFVRNERTDEQGVLQVSVPPEFATAVARLEVLATAGDQEERIETRLGVEPVGYVTHLSLDKSLYQPGETVYCRSLTLASYALAPQREFRILFEVLDAEGKALPGSRPDCTTENGAGKGACVLPADLAEGRYAAVVRSPEDLFPQQRQPFAVRRKPAAAEEAKPAGSSEVGAEGKTSYEGKSKAAGKVEVDFYPEGGALVGRLANRVYFVARDGEGRRVSIAGEVVDQDGHEVAEVETFHEGMGSFSFIPRPEQQYRLKISRPAGISHEPALPGVSAEHEVVLSTGTGVFDAAAPLEFVVRATEPRRPLIVSATCRGLPVGQQTLVSGEAANGTNTVVIPLDDGAGGVIHLAVYDYSETPPKPVAERLVYRRMQQPEGDIIPCFWLASGLGLPEKPEAAVDDYLSDDPQEAIPLDLLLGTHGWQPAAETRPPQSKQHVQDNAQPPQPATAHAPDGPPALFDNLQAIRAVCEQDLAAYGQQWARTLHTVTTMCFFGGLGLVLLVTMLGLLRVVAGVHLWVPAVGVTACCALVGLILMDPAGLSSDKDEIVAFQPFYLEPPASK